MPTPPLSDDLKREIVAKVAEHGSVGAAARADGKSEATYWHRYRIAKAEGYAEDPAIAAAKEAVGTRMTPVLAWAKTKSETGDSYSVLLKPEKQGEADLAELVRKTIAAAMEGYKPDLPKRPEVTGENLLIIDTADVHFLKLCVKSETGFSYNREVARHRVVEGVRALLRRSEGHNIGRILFVVGNDVLHIDGHTPKTTSGTPQDTDGSIFQGFTDAGVAFKEAIGLCADVAPVDIIHCMSNHDWVMGWALAQMLGAFFTHDPRVTATEYNISERHRKYYRFGSNLLILDHGDGVKDEKLLALAMVEARQHIAECVHIYCYRHHVHHKIRARRGIDVFVSEKDLIGMTAIYTGAPWVAGAHLNIEYVRSPSAPDGWHDRNGFVNRQGVECFIHCPHEGQNTRFTEWF